MTKKNPRFYERERKGELGRLLWHVAKVSGVRLEQLCSYVIGTRKGGRHRSHGGGGGVKAKEQAAFLWRLALEVQPALQVGWLGRAQRAAEARWVHCVLYAKGVPGGRPGRGGTSKTLDSLYHSDLLRLDLMTGWHTKSAHKATRKSMVRDATSGL